MWGEMAPEIIPINAIHRHTHKVQPPAVLYLLWQGTDLLPALWSWKPLWDLWIRHRQCESNRPNKVHHNTNRILDWTSLTKLRQINSTSVSDVSQFNFIYNNLCSSFLCRYYGLKHKEIPINICQYHWTRRIILMMYIINRGLTYVMQSTVTQAEAWLHMTTVYELVSYSHIVLFGFGPLGWRHCDQ